MSQRRRRSRQRNAKLLPNGETETVSGQPGARRAFVSLKRFRSRALRAYEADPSAFPVGRYEQGVNVISYDGFPYANNYSLMEKCWDRLNPGPPWYPFLGGPLRLIKVVSQWHVVQARGKYEGFPGSFGSKREYKGGFIPSYFGGDAYLTNASQETLLGVAGPYGSGYGEPPSGTDASAWNKFAPKQNLADASVFFAESGEVPRMLGSTARSFKDAWKALGGNSRGRPVKEASDQFLNDQFGWSPFLNDLKKMLNVYQKTDQLLRQLKRDNNRWIRRKGTFSQTTGNELHEHHNLPKVYPTLPTQMYAPTGGIGWTDIHKVDRTKIWFEADFKYYIQSYDPSSRVPNSLRRTMDLMRLYGARVNPSVLWEATPWSWLADWFSNTGKVIENITLMATDRLCSRYAFLMTQYIRNYVNHSVIRLKDDKLVCNWTQSLVSKRRKRASPFGFSFTSPDQFSARQWSILAALGFSRVL